MDEYMVILRLIHIFSGIAWVGSAWFITFLLSPAVRALGQDGQVFMRGFMKKSPVPLVMISSSLLTTVSGLLLYYRVSDGFSSDWMGSTAGVVLTIGSLAGFGEFLFGNAVVGPTTKNLGVLGGEIERQGGPPTEEQMARLHVLQGRMHIADRVSTILLVIAVVGMAGARYM